MGEREERPCNGLSQLQHGDLLSILYSMEPQSLGMRRWFGTLLLLKVPLEKDLHYLNTSQNFLR